MTKEKIDNWKLKYPDGIFELKVIHPKNKTEHFAYFKQPTLMDIKKALQAEDVLKGSFNTYIFNNCMLECDPLINKNNNMIFGIYSQIWNMVKPENRLK